MQNKGKYYITTAIAYTSGKPHIGNTYEIILADCIARYKRADGYDVSTGKSMTLNFSSNAKWPAESSTTRSAQTSACANKLSVSLHQNFPDGSVIHPDDVYTSPWGGSVLAVNSKILPGSREVVGNVLYSSGNGVIVC